MSTFLELSQRLRQESSLAGVGPSTVVSQTGMLKKICDWTSWAYKDIQNRHDNWRWMRTGFTFNTVSNTDLYAFGVITNVETSAFIARFGRWWAHDLNEPYLAYLTSGGIGNQYRLIYIPYDYFKDLYKIGTQNNGQPIHISVDNRNRLILGPKPNAIYTVTGEFQLGVQVLAVDADVPDMPANYHDLVVYYGMEKYGADAVAAEVYTRAVREGGRLLRALERSQLPEVRIGEPLA